MKNIYLHIQEEQWTLLMCAKVGVTWIQNKFIAVKQVLEGNIESQTIINIFSKITK